MEHTPPPFFNTGPSANARLLIFAVLSLALLVADARITGPSGYAGFSMGAMFGLAILFVGAGIALVVWSAVLFALTPSML